MALTYTLQIATRTAGDYRAVSPRTISNQQAITYDVLVYDTDPAVTLIPKELDEQSILAWVTELPLVNKSMYRYVDTTGDDLVAMH